MRISTAISALFAACVLASPIRPKRDIVEDIIVVTVTDYVLPDGEFFTEVGPGAYDGGHHGHPDSSWTPVAVPATSSTSPVAVSISTTAPAPASPTLTSTPAYTPPPAPPASSVPAPAAPAPAAPAPAAPAPAAPAPAAPAPAAPAPVAPVPASPATVTLAPALLAPVKAAPAPAAVQGSPSTLVVGLDPSSPTYAAIAVDHHNIHRRNHTAQDLTYDTQLAQWAQSKAAACVYDESLPTGASNVGMNIAQGTYLGAGNLSEVITNMWYNSEVDDFPAYGVDNLDTSPSSTFQKWGHFSAVVWSDTKAVGCGSAPCGAGTSIGSGYFTVCLYSPPGNFLGSFSKVHKPVGNPTVAIVGNNVVTL